MRFCVIGAGSMGGLYGGRLALAGRDVVLVDVWRDHVDAINREGLLLDGIGGEHRIAIRATDRAADAGKADVAIAFVDANSTADAARAAAEVLTDDGFALTLQNGIGNVEALSAVLGEKRVMGGLSYHSAALQKPGHVTHTNAGATWIGEFDGRPSPRLSALERDFGAADLNPTVVDDIRAYIWDKWILNSAINPVAAITGLRSGEIARTPEVDAFQTRIIDEILEVVRAKGIALHDPDIKSTIKKQCWKKFNKPSMLQHVELGKITEIDAMNGAVVRLAEEVGVATPFNEALTMLIKGLQKSRRQLLHEPPRDYAAMEKEAEKTPRPN
jgi:2-dehydropantoate 2-reductase